MNKDLKKLMQARKVNIEFSEKEVLILPAVAVIGDGRQALIKLIRRRISPVALKILEKRKEYN